MYIIVRTDQDGNLHGFRKAMDDTSDFSTFDEALEAAKARVAKHPPGTRLAILKHVTTVELVYEIRETPAQEV
jgi:hypothetical protein